MSAPRPTVLVTRELPPELLAPLRARCDVDMHASPEPMPRAALLAAAARRPAAILCTLSDRIDAEVLSACGPGLAGVATMSAGVNHVDVAWCARHRVRVGYTPGVLSEATADLVVALALLACRRLVQGVDAARGERGREWGSWQPFGHCGRDLHGAHVGIVGAGRIGTAVARRLRGFGCAISYTGPSGPKPDFDAEFGATWRELDALLAACDVVVLICALTPATAGLLDARRLRLMRPDAVLVNASRGEVVVQDALVAVLRERPGFSAGLDVTTPEPLPLDSELLRLPNCTVLPHLGSATVATRTEMARVTVANVLAALDGAEALPLEVPESAAAAAAARAAAAAPGT